MDKTKPSKSARKREYLALQELGVKLIDLSPAQLSSLQLDEALHEAVLDARGMNSHGALRRQKQLIGKLMREVDPEPIRDALDEFGSQDRVDKAVFRRAEKWRDRITDQGATALDEFFAAMGGPDEEISALAHELFATQHAAGRKQVRRKLFRALHGKIAAGMQNHNQ